MIIYDFFSSMMPGHHSVTAEQQPGPDCSQVAQKCLSETIEEQSKLDEHEIEALEALDIGVAIDNAYNAVSQVASDAFTTALVTYCNIGQTINRVAEGFTQGSDVGVATLAHEFERELFSSEELAEEALEIYDELKNKLKGGSKDTELVKNGLPSAFKKLLTYIKEKDLGFFQTTFAFEEEFLQKMLETGLLRMMANWANYSKKEGKVDLNEMLDALTKELAEAAKGDENAVANKIKEIFFPNGAKDLPFPAVSLFGLTDPLNEVAYSQLDKFLTRDAASYLREELKTLLQRDEVLAAFAKGTDAGVAQAVKEIEKEILPIETLNSECENGYRDIERRIDGGGEYVKRFRENLPTMLDKIFEKIDLGFFQKTIKMEEPVLRKMIEATLVKMVINWSQLASEDQSKPTVKYDEMLDTLGKRLAKNPESFKEVFLPNGADDLPIPAVSLFGLTDPLNQVVFSNLEPLLVDKASEYMPAEVKRILKHEKVVEGFAEGADVGVANVIKQVEEEIFSIKLLDEKCAQGYTILEKNMQGGPEYIKTFKDGLPTVKKKVSDYIKKIDLGFFQKTFALEEEFMAKLIEATLVQMAVNWSHYSGKSNPRDMLDALTKELATSKKPVNEVIKKIFFPNGAQDIPIPPISLFGVTDPLNEMIFTQVEALLVERGPEYIPAQIKSLLFHEDVIAGFAVGPELGVANVAKRLEKEFYSSEEVEKECKDAYIQLQNKLKDGPVYMTSFKKMLPYAIHQVLEHIKGADLGFLHATFVFEEECLHKMIEATLLRIASNCADFTMKETGQDQVDPNEIISVVLKRLSEANGDVDKILKSILFPRGAEDIRAPTTFLLGMLPPINEMIFEQMETLLKAESLKNLPTELREGLWGGKVDENKQVLEEEFQGTHVAEAAAGLAFVSSEKTKEWIGDNVDWLQESLTVDCDKDPEVFGMMKEMIKGLSKNEQLGELTKTAYERVFLQLFAKLSEHLTKKEKDDPELSMRIATEFFNTTAKYLSMERGEKVQAENLFQDLTNKIFEIADVTEESLALPSVLQGMGVQDQLKTKVVPGILKAVADSFLDQKWIEHKIIEAEKNMGAPDDGLHSRAPMPKSAKSYVASDEVQNEFDESCKTLVTAVGKFLPYGFFKFSERVTSHLRRLFSLPKYIMPLPLRFLALTFENPAKSSAVEQLAQQATEQLQEWPLSRLLSEGLKYAVDYDLFTVEAEEVPEHAEGEFGQAMGNVFKKQVHNALDDVLFGEGKVEKKGLLRRAFDAFILKPLSWVGWLLYKLFEPLINLYIHFFTKRCANRVRDQIDVDLVFQNINQAGRQIID